MACRKIKDIVAGAAILLLGGVMFITSFSISSGANTGMGPAFMPRLLSGLLAVLGTVILIGGAKHARTEKQEQQPEPSEEGKKKPDYISVILSVCFLLVYIAAIKPVGFMLSSMVYLFAQINLFTWKMEKMKTSRLFYLVISVVAAVVVFYIFTKGFKLMLPAGFLG